MDFFLALDRFQGDGRDRDPRAAPYGAAAPRRVRGGGGKDLEQRGVHDVQRLQRRRVLGPRAQLGGMISFGSPLARVVNSTQLGEPPNEIKRISPHALMMNYPFRYVYGNVTAHIAWNLIQAYVTCKGNLRFKGEGHFLSARCTRYLSTHVWRTKGRCKKNNVGHSLDVVGSSSRRMSGCDLSRRQTCLRPWCHRQTCLRSWCRRLHMTMCLALELEADNKRTAESTQAPDGTGSPRS